VFVDGASLRLGHASLARLDGDVDGGPGAAIEDGILRLKSGRLRHLPVLLLGDSASAHASLAVHAALRGDHRSTQSALGRAKAGVAETTARHRPGWASVTRAHVTLAEAQLLDFDGRHEAAEARYRDALGGLATARGAVMNGFAVGDAQELLAAELSRNLAYNLTAQGRGAEAQAVARRSLRAYIARFGQTPSYASGGLNGGAAGGFAQVAVNRTPSGAIVGHLLPSGVLIVSAIGPDDDSTKDARGEPGGTPRSPGPLGDESGVREPSGSPGESSRTGNGGGGNDSSRDPSGTAGGTSRSADGSGGSGTKDASGEAGGTSRSADGSGGSGTRDASGEAGGTSRSADGSGGSGTRDASGEAGGTSRSGG
jgi:hypothetical protein